WGRPEGLPQGPQGGRVDTEPPGPVPLPRRGGVAQLLSGPDPRTEGWGGAAEAQARAAEEGEYIVETSPCLRRDIAQRGERRLATVLLSRFPSFSCCPLRIGPR